MHQNTQYINDINDINAAAEPECGRTAGNRAACILTGKAIDCNHGSFREKDISALPVLLSTGILPFSNYQ